MAREYGSATWRYVNLDLGGTVLKYVHASRLKDSLKTEFGQTDITTSFNVQNAVLSPNSPKPARYGKQLADGYESGFISSGQGRALKADGFRRTAKAVLPTFNQTTLSRVLFVTINGVKYAWRRPRNAAGDVDVSALGAQDASNEVDLVFGADFPLPKQAVKQLEGQGSYVCFVDDSKVSGSTLDAGAIAAGWKGKGTQEISQEALLTILGIRE